MFTRMSRGWMYKQRVHKHMDHRRNCQLQLIYRGVQIYWITHKNTVLRCYDHVYVYINYSWNVLRFLVFKCFSFDLSGAEHTT